MSLLLIIALTWAQDKSCGGINWLICYDKKVKNKRVCVIIPAYNEETVIGSVIDGVKDTFKQKGNKYSLEVVVVDDGSQDNTASVAKKHGATVIQHILNSGTGAATATGVLYAKMHNFDIGATMDADGQHMPEDVFNGVEKLNKSTYDLLIGSRLMDSAGMSRTKILGNKGLSIITSLLFGINVTDSQSGLRILNRRALSKLRWTTTDYEFCSEMLWRAHQLNLHTGEYPIQAVYTEYSMAKGQNNWNAVNIIKSLVKRRIVEMFG